MGCRYCDLRGIYNNHIYYPTTPPSGEMNRTYDPLNLPKRTHSDYVTRVEQIVSLSPSKARDSLASNLGK